MIDESSQNTTDWDTPSTPIHTAHKLSPGHGVVVGTLRHRGLSTFPARQSGPTANADDHVNRGCELISSRNWELILLQQGKIQVELSLNFLITNLGVSTLFHRSLIHTPSYRHLVSSWIDFYSRDQVAESEESRERRRRNDSLSNRAIYDWHFKATNEVAINAKALPHG